MGSVRAAVVTDYGVAEVHDLPMPDGPIPGGALLRVEACGVCGSDWEFYTGRRIGIYPDPPHIIGHEVIGEIVALEGRAGERWGVEVGNRVAVEVVIPCWSCDACKSGRYNLCTGRHAYGVTPPAPGPPGLWGGVAEFMHVHPRSSLHRIPDQLSSVEATLFVPLANGHRWACRVPGLHLGETVVVIGPGQQGLGCVVAAREAGAGRIIVTGLAKDGFRLEAAQELGADHVVRVDEGDGAVAAVRELTKGRMADVVVECSGSPQGQADVVDLCGRGGRVVFGGLSGGVRVPLDLDVFARKEIAAFGANTHLGIDITAALFLLERHRVALKTMLTHTLPLEELDTALRLVGGELGQAIHVAMVP